MEYFLEIVGNNSFVKLTIRGEITSEKGMMTNKAAYKLGKENGINKYLVDITEARNVNHISQNYDFAYKDMNNELFDRFAKVAFLVDPADHSHDFLEIVLRNAGFIVQLFRNKEEALAFLLK
ncbi:MAG: hypothetical protein WAR79_02290 [Melioribacteraceae bacterium]